MLSSLSISNFALIKNSELFFDKGFNVILGQSGAGKSILIDALSFVLGGKADKSFIRSNEKMLKVDAVFDNISDALKGQLEELGIDCEDELVLSRSLNVDGKSIIRVNGSLVVHKTLKEITLNLIDFCGQHDSVGLLNVSNHLALLDRFIGNDVNILLADIESLYDKVVEIDKNISRLGGNETERNRLKEILKTPIIQAYFLGYLHQEKNHLSVLSSDNTMLIDIDETEASAFKIKELFADSKISILTSDKKRANFWKFFAPFIISNLLTSSRGKNFYSLCKNESERQNIDICINEIISLAADEKINLERSEILINLYNIPSGYTTLLQNKTSPHIIDVLSSLLGRDIHNKAPFLYSLLREIYNKY